MRLMAIRRFFWKGDEYQVGQDVEADEVKGPLLIAEGLAINPEPSPAPEASAASENSVADTNAPSEAADTEEAVVSKPKSKKRKR